MLPEDLVRKYYRLVDSNDFESLFNLFHKDIIYNRAGRVIRGLDDLKKFYYYERNIQGSHIIHNILASGTIVASQGEFRFVDDNIPTIYFAEIIVIDKPTSQILERNTYLRSNHQLIE